MSMYPVYRSAVLLLLFSCLQASGQPVSDSIPVYNRKLIKWELPVSSIFLLKSSSIFRSLERHASLTEAEVARLNPQDINAFDRPAAFYDPAVFDKHQRRSDLVLNIAVAAPALLLIDKKVRHDWLNYVNLLLLTHTVNNGIYFATAFSIRRARPLTYNTNLTLAERAGSQKSNSFFSGHVSFSSASTFFMAKTYTDHHHIKGLKRLLIYTGAAIPPAIVGYNRIKAGKHFKSDVITGFVVGAACGILIPELHRNKRKDAKLRVSPVYASEYSGLSLTYAIR